METRTQASGAAPSPLLQVDSITLAFGGVKALAGVGLDVQPGSVTAVVGPNGAWQDLAVQHHLGLLPAHRRQHPLSRPGETRLPRARVGMGRSFQSIALFRGLKALDEGRTNTSENCFINSGMASSEASETQGKNMNSTIQHQYKPSLSAGSAVPARLVNLEKARARHGARVDFMAEMVSEGDPLADAVILEINDLGVEARQKLNKGLAHGLDTVDNPPPAIAAFLRELETIPEWIGRDQVAAGDTVGQSLPPLLLFLSEQGIELIHVYASPSIARLLAVTGQLTKMAPRRALETSLWHEVSSLPGGMVRGGSGYLATAQVRLLHARMRHNAMRQGWDAGTYGVPINQTDIARTWLDFTIVPHLSLRKLGVTLTEEEQRERYRYWSYLGHVLGLDERFHLNLRSDRDAEEMLDLLDSTIDEPDDNCRALVEAILPVLVERGASGPLSMMDRESVRDFLNGLARYSFGDRLADALRIPHSQAVGFLPLFAASAGHAWRLQRSNPELNAACTKEYVEMRKARVAQMSEGLKTAYEKHATEK